MCSLFLLAASQNGVINVGPDVGEEVSSNLFLPDVWSCTNHLNKLIDARITRMVCVCMYVCGARVHFNTNSYIRCFIRVCYTSLLLSGCLSDLRFILKLTPHKSQANGIWRRGLWKVTRRGCGHEGGALWLQERLYLERKRDEVSSLLCLVKW